MNNKQSSKLSKENIIFIRKYPKYIGCGIKLAKKFNISPLTISRIRNNKTWQHLEKEQNVLDKF